MTRVTIVLLSFFITTNVAHASIFNIGPRIGGSISQLNVNEASKRKEVTDLALKVGVGYHIGVFTRFEFPIIYIQPELLLSGAGANFSTTENKEANVRFTKLDVPAMVGLSFFDNMLRAQVGPVFSILLRAVEGDKKIKEHYQDVTVGWQAGLGTDILNMIIDLKYEGNLSEFGDKIGNLQAKHGYGLWVLSLGFKII